MTSRDPERSSRDLNTAFGSQKSPEILK